MKPVVKKHKDARGRIVVYSAHVGPVSESGETPLEASTKCEQRVMDALGRLDRGAVIGRWRGHMYAVTPSCDGWRYWIDTFVQLDYSCAVVGAREDAVDAALHHLAQNVWSLDVDDSTFVHGLPDCVAERISDWMGFQRRYAAHKTSGKSDHESHRLACEGV